MKNLIRVYTIGVLIFCSYMATANVTVPRAMRLVEGSTYLVDGYQLTVLDTDTGFSGSGVLYFEALDVHLDVDFTDLFITEEGNLLEGNIDAIGGTRFLEITEEIQSIQGISLPERSKMFLSGFVKSVGSTTVSLDFDAATTVDREYLSFAVKNVPVRRDDICLEGVDMTMVEDGKVSDFEFPIRIIAGDPDDEKVGSYVTFDCKGFKNFALSAAYDFPKKQLVPYNAPDAKTKKDTVTAYFQIRSPQIGSYMAIGKVSPFMVPGVEDMSFTVDSLVVDFSEASNADGFKYVDKKTEKEVDESWKGIYIKELKMTLPKTISACNGGKRLEIAVKNLVYDRANGISLTVAANNILDIKEGSLNGWGISIDTIQMGIQYNSIEKFEILGEVYIPITAKDQNIRYGATFGRDSLKKVQANFVLKLGSTYTVPFLNNAELKLEESSVCGIRYQNESYEPYTNFSGEFNIKLGGEGSSIPEINFPSLGFQNLKLNDIADGVKQGVRKGKEFASNAKKNSKKWASEAKKQATAGLDNMTIGAFSIGGKVMKIDNGSSSNDSTAESSESNSEEESADDQKVGGFPINIKKWRFESKKDTIEVNGKKVVDDFKVLGADFGINFTGKKGGGLTGEANLGIKAKIDYAKLLSSDRWKAFQYKGTEIGKIAVKGQMGNTSFEGMLSFISAHKVYGTGLKGGFKFSFGKGSSSISALGQFGKVQQMRYFFIDIEALSETALIPLGQVDVHGIGGGLYYNMEQTPAPEKKNQEIKESNGFTLNAEPGISLSGAKYIPKDGILGFSASTVIALAKKPDVLAGDVALGLEFNMKTMGIQKLSFKGGAYFMSENLNSRGEAPIQANISMLADFKENLLSGSFGYKVNYPREDPIIVGSGQGAFQIDMDSEDNKEHKEYFIFGTPSDRFDIGLQIPKVGKVGEVNGYIMVGDSLAPPSPFTGDLAEYNKDPDVKKSYASLKKDVETAEKGAVIGMQLKFGANVEAGPIYMGFRLLLGFDIALLKNGQVFCKGKGERGMNGWYAKGQAYASMVGEAGINVDTWLYSGRYRLIDIKARALLQAELPNPMFFRGDLRIDASILAGAVKVNKNVKFTVGERCEEEYRSNAADLIADLEAIGDIQPKENQEDFQIYQEPRIAFNYPASEGLNIFPNTKEILTLKPNVKQTFKFYPFVSALVFKEKESGTEVKVDKVWDESKKILSLKTDAFLKGNTEYVIDLEVKWASRENDGSANVVKEKGKKVDKSEKRSFTFKTSAIPSKILVDMIDPKRHMPGLGQRNWHKGFAIPEIQFSKQGGKSYFADQREVTFGNTKKMVDYKYEVWLIDIASGNKKVLPITTKPGDKEFRVWKKDYVTTSSGNKMEIYRQVTELNKQIEFSGLNDANILDKNKIYKLQIVGIPKEDNIVQPNDTATVTKEVKSKLDESGLVNISSVKNKLSDQKILSVGIEPSILYEYHFKTSKYSSLKEKLEQSQKVACSDGTKTRTNPFPFTTKKELSLDNVEAKNTFSKFSGLRNDEGFDKWEQRRLQLNTTFDENRYKLEISGGDKYDLYNGKPTKINNYSDPRNTRMWYLKHIFSDRGLKLYESYRIDGSRDEYKFRAIFDAIFTDAWDVPWYWTEVRFGKDQPKILTQSEINNKKPETINGGRAEPINGNSNPTQDMDMAIAFKRQRVYAKQIEAAHILLEILRKKYMNIECVPYTKIVGRWYWKDKKVSAFRKPSREEVDKYIMKGMQYKGRQYAYFFQTLLDLKDINLNEIDKGIRETCPNFDYYYTDDWNSAEQVNVDYKYGFPDGTPPSNSRNSKSRKGISYDFSNNNGVNGNFYIYRRARNNNGQSRYVIDNDGGTGNTPLKTWDDHRGVSQMWNIRHVGSGNHYITNMHSGKRMDLFAGNRDDGNRIHQWDTGGARRHQEWKIQQYYGDIFRIKYDNDHCVDVQNALGRGKKVQIWGCEGRAVGAQLFYLRSTGKEPVLLDDYKCFTLEAKYNSKIINNLVKNEATSREFNPKNIFKSDIRSDKIRFQNLNDEIYMSDKGSRAGYGSNYSETLWYLERDTNNPEYYFLRSAKNPKKYMEFYGDGSIRLNEWRSVNDHAIKITEAACSEDQVKEVKKRNENKNKKVNIKKATINLK